MTVILPLAVPKTYSYLIPAELQCAVQFGVRVEVPLRNKLYSAVVIQTHDDLELTYKAKHIISVLDTEPIIEQYQYHFWQWIATYYCCTIGEVMNVALPSGLKLQSETKIVPHDQYEEHSIELTDAEYMVAEAVSIQGELTIDQIKDILDKKTVYPLIRDLIDKQVIAIKEELVTKYKPKKMPMVKFTDYYEQDRERLTEAFAKLSRSEHQTNALLAYVSLSRTSSEVPKSAIYELAGVTGAVLNALIKKDILLSFQKEVSRLQYDEAEGELPTLSARQQEVVAEIRAHHEQQKIVLLHGVTGSGKTRVYMELIREVIDNGQQCLYLLPEIALTTQIVARLQYVFGEDVVVFHSRLTNHERVELWKDAMLGRKLILGARSSMFLPFSNLGLVIVDEEHDPSYKQQDPAPRYNARDAATYLAHDRQAKVILGTATPSLETIHNATNEKYALCEMTERHGHVAMPEIRLIDLKKSYKTNRIEGFFSHQLIKAVQTALDNKEQVLLFQNRRGYAPSVSCQMCEWKSGCPNCDITLTYHKYFDETRCHYCGHRSQMPTECPACGSHDLVEKGIGTEKIESEVYRLFPDARVARMDFDTVRSKNSYSRILESFASREVDILVGTQMITKGLDFDNIAVVGVLNADGLLQFPDFRAGERAFQLLTQVAGRAGRRKKQGLVLIQTFSPEHPVLQELINNNISRFFTRELLERQKFMYPPYYKMIHLQLKHKKPQIVADAAKYMGLELNKTLGNRVLGPAEPGIARLKGLYLQNIVIKCEKKPSVLSYAKAEIIRLKHVLAKSDGFKSVRMKIDVDPY